MIDDPIIRELRKVKEEFAAEFDYDLRKISLYLQQQEKENQDRVVFLDLEQDDVQQVPAKRNK